jgi:pimeloyl-ACP methyl ester carboxylesterase
MEEILGHAPMRHAVRAMLLRFQPLRPDMEVDLPAAERLADHERSIAVPILLMWGARDETLPASDSERLRERLAAERYVLLEGLGHSPHQEGVARVTAEMRAFLATLDGAAATR